MEVSKNMHCEFADYIRAEIMICNLANPDIITVSYPESGDEKDLDLGDWDTNI